MDDRWLRGPCIGRIESASAVPVRHMNQPATATTIGRLGYRALAAGALELYDWFPSIGECPRSCPVHFEESFNWTR